MCNIKGDENEKIISKAVCIKNITVFSFVTLTCVLVLGVFVVKLMEDIAEGAELFIPGITVLFVAAIFVLVFAVSRVVKYIRLLKQL